MHFTNMYHGIDFDDFTEAVTKTDFILDDNGNEIKMKLIAGFFGISQNPDTKALRPALGWTTVFTSPLTPRDDL